MVRNGRFRLVLSRRRNGRRNTNWRKISALKERWGHFPIAFLFLFSLCLAVHVAINWGCQHSEKKRFSSSSFPPHSIKFNSSHSFSLSLRTRPFSAAARWNDSKKGRKEEKRRNKERRPSFLVKTDGDPNKRSKRKRYSRSTLSVDYYWLIYLSKQKRNQPTGVG